MQEQSAVLIGATGLIGHHLLMRLLENNAYSNVHVLVRKPLNMKHPKLHIHVVDFKKEAEVRSAMEGGNLVFSCVGTTQTQVKGNTAAYRAVDYDIPMLVAGLAKEMHFRSFLLVSAVGADAQSRNFYLKLKGEVEEGIIHIKLPSTHIFRPSLLLGKRKELRVGERIAQAIMPALSSLIPGKWAKYKPVEATTIADAMMACSLQETEGVKVYEFPFKTS